MKCGAGKIEDFNALTRSCLCSCLSWSFLRGLVREKTITARKSAASLLHSQYHPSQNPCPWLVQVSPTLTLMKTLGFETFPYMTTIFNYPNDSVEEAAE